MIGTCFVHDSAVALVAEVTLAVLVAAARVPRKVTWNSSRFASVSFPPPFGSLRKDRIGNRQWTLVGQILSVLPGRDFYPRAAEPLCD